jgi:AAA family ATP:ADP antiporter
MKSGTPEFSGLKAYLWPVHRYELKKLIPMLLIFFFITFDYNVLRTMKDALVVTAKSSGAEAIPFIKVWMMFPGAVLMTFFFTRLSNRFNRETVFYTMMAVFLGYFALFTFFMYPNRDALHLNSLADYLQVVLPPGCKGFIAMVRNWTFSSFYVMSELWGAIILFVLFWGFANQVTRIHEAKRFYGLFGIGANFSGVAAGMASIYVCSFPFNPSLPFGEDAWEQSMIMLIGLILLSGILTMALFRWMNKTVLTDPRYYNQAEVKEDKEVKGKLSLRDNFAYLLRSEYLICIAIIVMSYNMVINLVEVVWKHEVKELYPNPQDYNLYMNQVTAFIGVIATLSALLISGNSIRKCGWTFTAMLTPAILFVTSIGFFTFFFMKENLNEVVLALTGMTPLAIAVFFGSAQNVLSRGAKYSVFDATKEMAYVPLSAECKLKGKAAIDGVCSRLGKSGGSVIHQTLLLSFSTITASAPYVAGLLFIVIGLWGGATMALGRRFKSLTEAPQPVSESPVVSVLVPVENAIPNQQAV